MHQAAAALGACQNCAVRYLNFRPRGTCLRQGRKTKDASRSVTCTTASLGCVSMCRLFWSRAKSCAVLGGTLGENAAWCSGHCSSAQADGCGLSPAAGPVRHVVLCGHRSVFSSPPRRRMFRLLAFFHEPLPRQGANQEECTGPQVSQHQIHCHFIMNICCRHCQSVNHPQTLLPHMHLLA